MIIAESVNSRHKGNLRHPGSSICCVADAADFRSLTMIGDD
jgi:hypothetical protein